MKRQTLIEKHNNLLPKFDYDLCAEIGHFYLHDRVIAIERASRALSNRALIFDAYIDRVGDGKVSRGVLDAKMQDVLVRMDILERLIAEFKEANRKLGDDGYRLD